MKDTQEDHAMRAPVPHSIRSFLEGTSDVDDFDADTLATLTEHYARTVLSGRLPNLSLFHYADMILDGRTTVERLAKAAKIDTNSALLDAITEATSFGAMNAKAADYAPVGGTGFWKSDAGFFDSASSQKWEGQLTVEEIELYSVRPANLIPDAPASAWLENGDR